MSFRENFESMRHSGQIPSAAEMRDSAHKVFRELDEIDHSADAHSIRANLAYGCLRNIEGGDNAVAYFNLLFAQLQVALLKQLDSEPVNILAQLLGDFGLSVAVKITDSAAVTDSPMEVSKKIRRDS